MDKRERWIRDIVKDNNTERKRKLIKERVRD